MSRRRGKTLCLSAIGVVISVAMALVGWRAVAEPLDKESCAKLQSERKQLLNRDMQTALEQGPDWVKTHLTDEAIERVRRFLSVEEQIQFRCRGGGVAKPAAKATDASAKEVDTVPLPDRKPTPPSAAMGDSTPSQALANSDKTTPGKAKATR